MTKARKTRWILKPAPLLGPAINVQWTHSKAMESRGKMCLCDRQCACTAAVAGLAGTGAQAWAVLLIGCAISANARDLPAAKLGLLQWKEEKIE